MKAKVEEALNKIRPWLQADGGDVELVAVSEDSQVTVRLTGACHGCPMAQMTLLMGVRKNVMEMVPEVSDVIAI